jgi:hypothetical protein
LSVVVAGGVSVFIGVNLINARTKQWQSTMYK